MKEFFGKVKEFVKKWFVEIGFVVLSLLLWFSPITPHQLATLAFILVLYSIIKGNKKQ